MEQDVIEGTFMVTLNEDALFAASMLAGRLGHAPTIEAFIQRAIAYGLRANRQDVKDSDIHVDRLDGE